MKRAVRPPRSKTSSALSHLPARSGVTEPFSREKVVSGVRRACQGRQVDDDVTLGQLEGHLQVLAASAVPR